jgi:predicted nucleic acid-binding protein
VAHLDGPLTAADLISIGTRSVGITRLMPDVVMPVVVDANVLIEDLLRYADDKGSSLLGAALLGSARLYATEAILDEVNEHLPEVTPKKARDIDALRSVFQHAYLPYLRLVDVSDLTSEDERIKALELEDPDDVDAAKLAILLAPSFLLTSDRDLLRHGLGVVFEPSEGQTGWTFGAVALQDRGLIIGVITGGTGGAMGIGYAGVVAVDAIKSIRNDERLILAGLVILASLAILFALSPRARSRAVELADAFTDVAGAIARGVGTAIEWSEEARQILALNAIQNPLANGDLERVARTLAISRPGVAVEELSDVLSDIAGLETVLMSSHMFVEVASGKWALGLSASSMRPTPPAPG